MRTKEQTKRDKLLQNFKLYKTQLINSQKFISQITAKAFFRSSRPDVFCKKGVLKSFAKFTGKHLCQRLFFNKEFSCEFAKFLRTPFFTEHLWWLLLFFEERSNNYKESGMVSDAISAPKQTFRIKTNP